MGTTTLAVLAIVVACVSAHAAPTGRKEASLLRLLQTATFKRAIHAKHEGHIRLVKESYDACQRRLNELITEREVTSGTLSRVNQVVTMLNDLVVEIAAIDRPVVVERLNSIGNVIKATPEDRNSQHAGSCLSHRYWDRMVVAKGTGRHSVRRTLDECLKVQSLMNKRLSEVTEEIQFTKEERLVHNDMLPEDVPLSIAFGRKY
ncbi:Uncharacterized protein PBTT_01700 [Plasmodiophora brassicae]